MIRGMARRWRNLSALCVAVAVMAVLPLAIPTPSAADEVPEPSQNPSVPFRLFRTQNIYTLLKLDTRTGQVWQVQWGSTKQRLIEELNTKVLAPNGRVGRFTLYPTKNIYTFVLLDQDTGSTWQIQWGDEENRFIYPIE